jgi:hypothetical protein
VAIAVLVLSGLLTILLRSADGSRDDATPALDETGVCAEAALHPRCTALLVGASGVLELLKTLPLAPSSRREDARITVPGSGDPVLAASTQTTLSSADVRGQVMAVMRTGGWTALAASAELLRFQRGDLTAAMALVPSSAGLQLRLSVTG